jgi:WAS family protein 1
MNVNQVFSIGVTFHNIGESDSIEEAINAIKHLYSVTEQVFDKIETKVKYERSKIEAISQRLTQASAQIETIGRERISKATTVFSNAKFPGKKEADNYSPIFANMPFVDCPPDNIMQENAPRVFPANDGNRKAHPPQADMLDLLWRANQTLDLDGITGAPKGVGPLPDDMMSVTDFMLYNSNETPYTDYNDSLDNMFEVKQRDAIEEETKRKMAAQGSTLLGGDQLPAVQGLDMTYKPTMKAQPTLQFQTNLDFGASLPAVASDAAWSQGADDMSSIAPSAFQDALQMLPALTDAPSSNALGNGTATTSNTANPPPPPPNTAAATPPPPPPPPPPAPRSRPPAPRGGPRPRGAPPMNGARPPPLPSKAPPKKNPTPSNAGRGGLLDAIKRGKKLKKKTDRKVKEIKKIDKPMSLMDQMKARLGRRANVMSGRDDEIAQKNRKRRVTVVGKTVTTLVGMKNRAQKRVAAKTLESKNNSGSDDDSEQSFNDSDGDNDPAPLKNLPTKGRPRRRSSEIADTVISKNKNSRLGPMVNESDEKSVGGFNTKGMAGLTALLAHKKSATNMGKDRASSIASSVDDWDSD